MEICAKYEKQANSQLYFHICQQSTDNPVVEFVAHLMHFILSSDVVQLG